MKKRKSTHCFSYEDHLSFEVGMAHADPIIIRIADYVLKNPALLKDLSLLLLPNTTPASLKSEFISKTYRLLKGRDLNQQEEILGELLDRLYDTPYQDTLEARRGVVLERIIQEAIKSRVLNGTRGEVVNNLRKLAPGKTNTVVNNYSVDVAACFHAQSQTEFYACKLKAIYMEPVSLELLDEIGEAFTYYCAYVRTALSCLQLKRDLHPIRAKLDELLEPYPNIELITVESIHELMR